MNELLRMRTALALAVTMGLALPGMATAENDTTATAEQSGDIYRDDTTTMDDTDRTYGDDATATERTYGDDATAMEDTDDTYGDDRSVVEQDRQPLDEAREKEPMAGTEPELADEPAEDGGPVRDAWVQSKLESSYALDDNLSALDIDTDVESGNVTLSGTVATEDQRELAEEVALGIDGVTAVDNQLMVGTDASPPEGDDGDSAMRDSTLTAEVKSKLISDDSIDGGDIDVDTEGAVVTLRGRVSTEEERSRALEIAREVDDVQSVQDELVVMADE